MKNRDKVDKADGGLDAGECCTGVHIRLLSQTELSESSGSHRVPQTIYSLGGCSRNSSSIIE